MTLIERWLHYKGDCQAKFDCKILQSFRLHHGNLTIRTLKVVFSSELTSWKMLCPYLSVQSMSAPFFRTVSTYSRLMLSVSSLDWARRAKYSMRLRLCATTMCFCVLVRLASHTSTSSTSNVRPIPPVLRRSNPESPPRSGKVRVINSSLLLVINYYRIDTELDWYEEMFVPITSFCSDH